MSEQPELGLPDGEPPGADDAGVGPAPSQDAAGPDIPDGPLKRLVDGNFIRYASYVIRDRAIPDLDDGLKPVQRRILHSLHEIDDGRFTKVANVVGYSMQFHPHGDASITDALIALVNRQYLIEGQGNFGNLFTGDPPAAARYIECRLTPLAREELFNDELADFVPSYDGRKREPVNLPVKIPLLLMLGADGIAVGLSTRILPHNFNELIEAQMAILRKQPFVVLPDFPQGGLMDASGYDEGRGSVLLRARIAPKDAETLVIREVPFGTTTDSLIASIEDAARRGRIALHSINDFTADKVEIEIRLQPGQDAARAIETLYAFTQCQVQVSSRIVVIHDGRPREMDVPSVLRHNTGRLLDLLRKELKLRQKRLTEELHRKTLVQLFVENRLYQRLESCRSQEEVLQSVRQGLEAFRPQLQRDLTHADIDMVLGIPIRRISHFDAGRNRQEMEKIVAALAEAREDLANLVACALRYLRGLQRKYADSFPRRTRIESFGAIQVRELTAHEWRLCYDRHKGYLGHKVSGDPLLECSSLDRILLVWKDGRLKVIAPPEKLFVDSSLAFGIVVKPDWTLTVAYTEEGQTYAKQFGGGTVLNREYRCAPKGAEIRMITEGAPSILYVRYVPGPARKIVQQEFPAHDLPMRDRDARGVLMTSKPIEYIGTSRPPDWDDALTGPPGRFMTL